MTKWMQCKGCFQLVFCYLPKKNRKNWSCFDDRLLWIVAYLVFVSHAINLGSTCKLQKAVLKGVITGCNIRCFCPSCNGSKAVSAYYFEQHAGSTKKHPADYIYLGNGSSLRDVLRASERSPLEALEKTIRSSIGPVVNGATLIAWIATGMFLRHHKLNMYCVDVASTQSNLKIIPPHHIHVRAIPGKQFEQIMCYMPTSSLVPN